MSRIKPTNNKKPVQHDMSGKPQPPWKIKTIWIARKNEEYNTKGDDITHNKKNTKAGKLHKQNK